MDNKNIIGSRLNAALARRNVKQKELAQYLNVPDNTISYFCSGKRTPNVQQIAEIAKRLEISTDYLLGVSDVMSADTATRELCLTLGVSESVVDLLRGNIVWADPRFSPDTNALLTRIGREHFSTAVSALAEDHISHIGKEERSLVDALFSFEAALKMKNNKFVKSLPNRLELWDRDGETTIQEIEDVYTDECWTICPKESILTSIIQEIYAKLIAKKEQNMGEEIVNET